MHMRTHLFSPFVPLACVATCAPIFAIATQVFYLAVQTCSLFSLVKNHHVVVSFVLVSCPVSDKCRSTNLSVPVVISGYYVVSRPFSFYHWRPILERPTTLRSSHAQPSSTAIRLVYVNLVSSMSVSSLLRTSSRLYQPRLSYANLVSSRSSHAGQLPFSLSFFCMRSFFVKFIFVNFFVVCARSGVLH